MVFDSNFQLIKSANLVVVAVIAVLFFGLAIVAGAVMFGYLRKKQKTGHVCYLFAFGYLPPLEGDPAPSFIVIFSNFSLHFIVFLLFIYLIITFQNTIITFLNTIYFEYRLGLLKIKQNHLVVYYKSLLLKELQRKMTKRKLLNRYYYRGKILFNTCFIDI